MSYESQLRRFADEHMVDTSVCWCVGYRNGRYYFCVVNVEQE